MKKTKTLKTVKLEELIPYSKNEKVHTNDNLDLIKLSLETVGYITPIVIDEHNTILAGHGRFFVMQTMKEYKEKDVEVLVMTGLTQLEKDKFRLFDNQTARTGHYDNELLIDTVRSILGEDSGFNISALSIDGLVNAFSSEEFTFDLGKVTTKEKTSRSKVLVVISEDLESVMEILNVNNINYNIGYETTR
jgi:hypothetical protein